MLTIHKYDLGKHAGRIEMPVGATVLCIQYQDNKPFLWAKVDTDKPLRHRSLSDTVQVGKLKMMITTPRSIFLQCKTGMDLCGTGSRLFKRSNHENQKS